MKIYSTFDLKSAYHQIPRLEQERQYTAFEADGNLYQFTRIPFGVTNGVSAFQRVISDLIRQNELDQTWAFVDNVTVGGLTQEEHDQNVQRFMDLVTRYNLTLNQEKTISSVTEINMLGYCISHLKVRPDPARMHPLFDIPVPTDSKSLKRTLGSSLTTANEWFNSSSNLILLYSIFSIFSISLSNFQIPHY
ncbi:MAG: RNA-directed DNA polymerase, partial [Proteobacteria bacterium]|nr:RNA-directed DNA polymerase [Pseudomonadota bacterium]